MNIPPVQYVTTSDGFNIAYTVSGSGRPLVMVPPGFHNVQIYWEAEGTSNWCQNLASRFNLVTYDSRGQGLSTRGLPESYSSLDRTRDLECIVDYLALHRMTLLGVGSSCHTAVHYAALHPDRVEALVLISCSVTSRPWPPALYQQLASGDWDTFLYLLSQGGGSHEEALQRVDSLKRMVTQADFTKMTRSYEASTMESDLPEILTPTLVIHPRETRAPSFDDCAEVASRIAHARVVVSEGGIPGMAGDSVSGISAIVSFLAELPAPERDAGEPPGSLSQRETEVLQLIAQGKSNPEIAKELFITRNTVQNHVSSILAKTNLSNRAQAAVYAQRHNLI